jgi:hypothetical protein
VDESVTIACSEKSNEPNPTAVFNNDGLVEVSVDNVGVNDLGVKKAETKPIKTPVLFHPPFSLCMIGHIGLFVKFEYLAIDDKISPSANEVE